MKNLNTHHRGRPKDSLAAIEFETLDFILSVDGLFKKKNVKEEKKLKI